MKNLFRNISLLSFAALLLFVSACKKDKNTGGGNCVLNSVINTGMDTALITYDAQGRVASYGSVYNFRVDFSYAGLTVNTTITTPDTTEPFMDVFLNSKGNIQSMNRTIYSGGNRYDYTYTFEYDADEHITVCEQTFHESGSLITN